MDFLNLPILDREQSLAEAADAMARTDRRAVVVKRATGEYHIYANVEIRDARREGKTKLSELPDSSRVARALQAKLVRRLRGARRESDALRYAEVGTSSEPPSAPLPDAGLTYGLQQEIEDALDKMGVKYGVVSAPSPMVVVATRHEYLADAIRSANKVCNCDHNHKHTTEEPPAKHGTPCEFGDGTYECY